MSSIGKGRSSPSGAGAREVLTATVPIEIVPDAGAAASRGAALIARLAREAVLRRGRFILAVSGGETPQSMFRELALEDMPWASIHLVQVDERVAPLGSPFRNLTSLQENLLNRVPLPRKQIYRMPVEADDQEAAGYRYAKILQLLGGSPPLFDLVHLGLGADGHVASLVPGDLALDVKDEDVVLTAVYRGRRRMTLTYPIIDRARRILWLVTGAAKAEMLSRLYKGDTGIPAGRVNRRRATILADQAAAALVMA